MSHPTTATPIEFVPVAESLPDRQAYCLVRLRRIPGADENEYRFVEYWPDDRMFHDPDFGDPWHEAEAWAVIEYEE